MSKSVQVPKHTPHLNAPANNLYLSVLLLAVMSTVFSVCNLYYFFFHSWVTVV